MKVTGVSKKLRLMAFQVPTQTSCCIHTLVQRARIISSLYCIQACGHPTPQTGADGTSRPSVCIGESHEGFFTDIVYFFVGPFINSIF